MQVVSVLSYTSSVIPTPTVSLVLMDEQKWSAYLAVVAVLLV